MKSAMSDGMRLACALAVVLGISALSGSAQAKPDSVPYVPGKGQVEVNVSCINGVWMARVHLRFPTEGYQVTWSPVQWRKSTLIVPIEVRKPTRAMPFRSVVQAQTYNLGTPPRGSYRVCVQCNGRTVDYAVFSVTQQKSQPRRK